MYKHICKECNKEFINKHKNQIYCSRNCFLISLAKKRETDIIGKKFGKLLVISYVGKKGKKTLWDCKCDCGNFLKNVSLDDLRSGHTKSCGCLRKDLRRQDIKNKFKKFSEENYVENTSLSQLKANFRNNTSGCKGVCWDKKNQNWRAYIYFKNKRYHLGSYKDINLAIKARKEAEEKYFKPILDKYNKENKNKAD